MIEFNDFLKVEMHVGRILEVNEFLEAKQPAYKLGIDFGPKIGFKKSSAQITELYSPEDLHHRLIVAVTNFPPKQIANFLSEVLVLGVATDKGQIALLSVEEGIIPGSRVY